MKLRAILTALFFLMICSTYVMTGADIERARKRLSQDITLEGNGCLVLSYHRVRPSGTAAKILDRFMLTFTKDPEILLYSVYEDELEAQLEDLIRNGFQFITPGELNRYIKKQAVPSGKCALITFDDVDESVYRQAYPILAKHRIPFTLFIITGEVGNPDFKKLRLATWDQIIEMKDSGLATIGTHTHKMHGLDKEGNPPFMKADNVEAFKRDTALSKEAFGKRLGAPPLYFAYPYGFGMPETDGYLLESGYELLFTLHPGTVEAGDPSFMVKRVLISMPIWSRIMEWAERDS